MAKKKTEYQTEKPKSTATTEYRKLTDVIQALYFAKGYTNDDIPWTLLVAQIKNMNKDHISYTDIKNTIQYMITFEGKDISDVDTLGLVPYYLDRARNYMLQYKEKKQNAKSFQFTEDVNKVTKHSNSITFNRKNETFDD